MSRFWDRLEPNSTDETLIEGMQTRIADPLWMMARQWQVGELDGEDAASPIQARLVTNELPFTQLTFADGRQIDPRKTDVPIEALIEAVEPQRPSAATASSLIALGWARLGAVGLDGPEMRNLIRKAYPFKPDRYRPGEHPVPTAAARRLRLLETRGFDPIQLVKDKGRALIGQTKRDGGLDQKAIGEWVGYVAEAAARRGHKIAKHNNSWQDQELSYSAHLSTRAGETEVHLKLQDYGGGRLDWYSFDRSATSVGKLPPNAKIQTRTRKMTPLPLTYAGQPRHRFWEFEDGAVQFGSITAGPGDIARMLVADFAATGGDDMFMFPVPTEVGRLVRVKSLQFDDTFGRRHDIPAARQEDRVAVKDGLLPFDLFSLGAPFETATGTSDWLPILPTVTNPMNSAAIERVALRRDEDANLAWAVEETIAGPFGRPLRRRQFWEAEEPKRTDEEDDMLWPYRLQARVPPWWVPLVPERIKGAEVQLRRARLGAWEQMDSRKVGPLSQLMDRTRPITIAEHAVPASGVRVSRHWQIARTYDGTPILWHSWRRQAGAEERVSGLRFDTIDRAW